MNFSLKQTDSGSSARRGVLRTAHGDVQTPVFMPVGTAAAIKGTTAAQVEETGAEIVLSNTYHLMLRPGVETIEKLGGIHNVMAWEKPILTDSGGYQIFSLEALTKINDNGVEFSSHVDGKNFFIDAKIATDLQNRIGADIIMCFDQCAPYPADEKVLLEAVERSIRWAGECKEAHANPKQMLFGIVQGGIDLELRSRCAKELVDIGFDGYAIGGLSVGEGHEKMIRTVEHTAAILPEDKARYLMGVGTPADIIAAVRNGVDMFDCVLPTRNGRNAFAFTEEGPMRLRNSVHINDTGPIEEGCDCYCCQNYCRGALRHYFNVKEMLGPILVSLHNLRFYQRLMSAIRQKIEADEFAGWSEEKLKKYKNLYH
ncbi:MAG: tRNA guanosine(34) transglycosylase Tgt [Planctomycetes bacterium]|nr:tRNA guanosine(34) transglycosylase Tgt [Planctomycetota bacterium]